MSGGLPGRRSLPISIHEARGTARPDRINAAAPEPPSLEVGSKPPSWLRGARRRRAWAELVELLTDQRLLTVMDAAALAMLVDAYGDYLEAGDVLTGAACAHCGLTVSSKRPCTAVVELEDKVVALDHEPGYRYYTTRTQTGALMIRPHPAVTVHEKSWARVVAMLGRFGMDPSSRGKVSAASAADRDPMAALLEDVG